MNRGDNMRFCREANPGGIIMHAPMPRLFFLKGKSHLPSSVQQESSGAKVAAPRSSLQFIRCDIKNIIRIFISVVIPEGHRTKGALPGPQRQPFPPVWTGQDFRNVEHNLLNHFSGHISDYCFGSLPDGFPGSLSGSPPIWIFARASGGRVRCSMAFL